MTRFNRYVKNRALDFDGHYQNEKQNFCGVDFGLPSWLGLNKEVYGLDLPFQFCQSPKKNFILFSFVSVFSGYILPKSERE